jgi:lipopolysaccharide transport system permease protein
MSGRWVIKPEIGWFSFNFKEIADYKDLLFRLVRKEFLSSYQQTLLGASWVLLQPLLTVLIYVLIFGKIIGLSTDGAPSFLYYLIGITLWNLFSDLFLNTAQTFTQNATIFSKVYFPRLIAPLSMLLLNLLRFGIQFLFLIIVLVYYHFKGQVHFYPIQFFLFLPVVILTTGIAFGAGLIFAVASAKYRDLLGLTQILIRLLMFACPIFFSLSIVPEEIRWAVNINPLSSLFELFRYSFLGTGQVFFSSILYSTLFMVFILFCGLLLFNKLNDKLIDVI